VETGPHLHARGRNASGIHEHRRARAKGNPVVTCAISGSQTDEQGDAFSLSGTVSGWISWAKGEELPISGGCPCSDALFS
jgi:hypothetical protein